MTDHQKKGLHITFPPDKRFKDARTSSYQEQAQHPVITAQDRKFPDAFTNQEGGIIAESDIRSNAVVSLVPPTPVMPALEASMMPMPAASTAMLSTTMLGGLSPMQPLTPLGPLEAMEHCNRQVRVCKEYIKNQRELARNAIMSAEQGEMERRQILPLHVMLHDQSDAPQIHLPPLVADVANYLGKRYGLAPIGLAMQILAAISIATWGRVKIRLDSEWEESAIDMLIQMTESGKMKSAPIRLLRKPFEDFAANYNEQHHIPGKESVRAKKIAAQAASKLANMIVMEAMHKKTKKDENEDDDEV